MDDLLALVNQIVPYHMTHNAGALTAVSRSCGCKSAGSCPCALVIGNGRQLCQVVQQCMLRLEGYLQRTQVQFSRRTLCLPAKADTVQLTEKLLARAHTTQSVMQLI